MRKKPTRPPGSPTGDLVEAPDSFQPLASPAGDLRKLRRHTSATAGELRAFLAELRGKSPKEMLGEVASSELGRSAVTATVGAAILILVFTAIPYAWSRLGDDAPPSAAPHAPPAAAADPAPPPDSPSPSSNADPLATPAAAQSLGIDEAESAPPNVTPLDAANDDLLEGLE
ncbi:hypothetical protein BH23VER1_BH23VER1_05300 [soil metagenome]